MFFNLSPEVNFSRHSCFFTERVQASDSRPSVDFQLRRVLAGDWVSESPVVKWGYVDICRVVMSIQWGHFSDPWKHLACKAFV